MSISTITLDSEILSISDVGFSGLKGDDGTSGSGVPAGGTADQVLAKIDATDGNTEWSTLPTASLAESGMVELATVAETNAGTDATRAVTPDGLDGWTGADALVGSGITYREAVAVSDNDTAFTTGIKFTWYSPPYAITITDAEFSVLTAPTGAGLVVDVHDDGTSIMATDKLDIDVSEFHTKDAATQPVISAGSIAASSKMEVEIDQIGSTVAGAGGVLYLYYTIDV